MSPLRATWIVLATALSVLLVGHPAPAAETLRVPFLFWGGDVATFHANGGLRTTPDSLYGKQGLDIELVAGDDFSKQVEDYVSGKSPFLRGTLSMLGQESKKLTDKPELTPVVFLQLTWSAGDHLVGRETFRNLNTLKGRKIALQKGGPHVGMLNDILNTVKLEWKDITVVWTDDVSGAKGPAELFRKDPGIDACFCISPEMYELTSAPEGGSLKATGDGTKKSIKGARVVVSTAQMSRSIADVYACRKDFYDKNKDQIEKFVAGYLKASEEVVGVKNRAAGKDKAAEEQYKQVIKQAQDIWGKDPAFKEAVAREDDVDGLISDAVFVGLPGNESFFTAKGNLSGFEFKQTQALVLPPDPTSDRHKVNPRKFLAGNLDYARLRQLGSLQGKKPSKPRISASAEDLDREEEIFTFTIRFQPNSADFPESEFGKQYQRALEQASLFGNSAVVIRGHADTINLEKLFLEGGQKTGLLVKQTGTTLDLKKDWNRVFELIDKNPDLVYSTSNGPVPVKSEADYLQKLSEKRAAAVRTSIVNYSKGHNLLLEESQLKSVGVGAHEPSGPDNRRVEFRIVKVPEKNVFASEFELEK
jgi:ABC-type nitrate/sulfonate/bicarbonate transport system substrate-binding protein